MNELGNGLIVDSSGTIYYNGKILTRSSVLGYYPPLPTYYTTFDGNIDSDSISYRTDNNMKDLLEEFLKKDSGDSKEYLDLITEFLRKRLELVLDNPDLVNNLKILETIDKANITAKVEALVIENNELRARICDLERKISRILDEFSEIRGILGNEEI